ncbi:MAG: FGGY-family carbohydrate kinase [Anaerolineaceae bacterium]|nr:FGGY-family carbohydrate kinase [Anaerolineaceae bacterium]
MEKTSYILAVDLGTSGCKSALISITGQVAGWEFQEVPLQVLPNGGAEQNPQDWWEAFLETSKRLIQKSLVPVEDIAAVCCSTQGEGTVAVDRDGSPLMNCILWMDMRGAKHLNQITQGLVNVAGYDPFKLIRWIKLTGGAPSLTGKDPAAHMLFIRETYPDIYKKTFKFLNVLDYMNLCLTGRFVATPDSILTSWVTDNRNSAQVVYDEGLLHDCGIAADKFPELVPCTEVIGELKQEVAEILGLKAGVKVVAGAIDTTSAAIGSGAIADYEAHLSIGTSSWMAAHMPVKKTDIGSSVASVPCAIPGKFLMIIMQTTAGGNLTFLRDKILYHKDELLREEQAPDVYKILDRIAAKVPAGSNGLIYTPWIYGERSPIEDRTVRAAIINLSLENSREDIIRAFLEGVALNTRWLLAPTEKFLGRKLSALNMVGGGAKSDVWCQIFADVLNLTIRQVCDPIQVNARGAAFIAAVGLDRLAFPEIPQYVQFQAIYQPDAQTKPVYDKLFGEFVTFYKQNKAMYRRLNG